MKERRKIIALAMAVAMSLALLAACGPTDSDNDSGTGSTSQPIGIAPTSSPGIAAPPPVESDVVFAEHLEVVFGANNIAVINPFVPASNTPTHLWAFTMIYDRLIERVGLSTTEFAPSLAIDWWTDDYQTFTFELRQGVRFHNGDAFTARDVENTIRMAQNSPGTRAYDAWRTVDTIEVLGDYSIRLTLQSVNVDFLFVVTGPQTGILNKRAIDSNADTGTWVGTGPYIVADFLTNDFTTFERNEDYWGAAPLTRSQSWRFIPEPGTRTVLMQNGNSDVGFNIAVDDLFLFDGSPDRFNIFPLTMMGNSVIIFNMTDPIVGDHNFRMAVAHAIDREEISLFAVGNWGAVTTSGTMWGFATEFRNDDIPMRPYDLDLARQFLAASPYAGEEIELTTAMPLYIKGSEAIQQQLNRIGINIRINQMDAPSLSAYATWGENRAQMVYYALGFTSSAVSARNNMYAGASDNRAEYNNPIVNEMFDRAVTVTDPVEREAIYREIQVIVAEDMPFLNTFHPISVVVSKVGVGGIALFSEQIYNDLRGAFMVLDG